MANFKVVFEIEGIEEDSPLLAAKTVQKMLRRDSWQFYVQDSETEEIFSVDLQEEDSDAVLPVQTYTPLIK